MISGYCCVRNAIKLDYPVSLTIESLIPVCDEVVISDGESDDGTLDILHDWAKRDSRVRIVTYPWDNPQRDIGWWVRWLNETRKQLRFQSQLALDADEVLDPIGYDAIRYIGAGKNKSAFFERQNYWGSPATLAPDNRCCGLMVARLGPTWMYMPSDEPNPAEHPNVRTYAKVVPDLIIHHLGFLRKPESFIEKSKVVQNAFFGSVDDRLVKHADAGTDWRKDDYFDGLPLKPARYPIPEFVKPWLRERKYDI